MLVILLLLAIISIIGTNKYNKNKTAMLENANIEIIDSNPNIPKLAAGMIPVKYENGYWQITSKNDNNWYDYANGKPAYMMLNDGYYRSELEQGVKEEQLMQNNVGVFIARPEDLGSIYMWIPRFEENNETGEIKYIQGVGEAEDGYTIPNMFAYKQAETMPDFLLTGMWVAVDTDENYATTINNMTGEDNTYGFIANTKAMQITSDDINAIANTVGRSLSDQTNTNRIILKIIKNNNIDPIKAKATLDTNTMEVTINVTYTKNGIAKIEDENGNILSENSKTATDTILCNGTYYYTITDKQGNNKKVSVTADITTTLTFNVNGGTSTVSNITTGFGDTITLPIPERKYTVSYVTNNSQELEDTIVAYTFDGWYKAATDGEKREYTTMPAHNETLYAHWTETSITLPILTPESEIYTFEGWYSDSGLTTSVGATYTPTSNITLYAKWDTPYGKEVTNYTCTAGGVDTWRIFHIDDEHIYLIADGYVPNANLPKSTEGNSLYTNGPYRAYFPSVLDDYSGSAWISANSKAKGWLDKYLTAYPSSKKDNIKAVAYMMDTNSWSGFANSTYAEYAIGGPTLELFCASYKVTHPDRYIECDYVTDYGYRVKWSDGDYGYEVDGLGADGEFNNIYILSNRRVSAFWIASPSTRDEYYLFTAEFEFGQLTYDTYDSRLNGFRPVICLKSSVKLVSNGDGTYQLKAP